MVLLRLNRDDEVAQRTTNKRCEKGSIGTVFFLLEAPTKSKGWLTNTLDDIIPSECS
jgi:hypothetical protein